MPEVQTPFSVFYSYARTDKTLVQKLDRHLSLLKHQGLITTWHRGLASLEAKQAQHNAMWLERASIILLLISSDFLASDICYSVEMQQALKRHETHEARVIPILLRPTDWESAPFAHLQVLPTNAQPITAWSNEDQAFADVAAGIRQAIDNLVIQQTFTHSANSDTSDIHESATELLSRAHTNSATPVFLSSVHRLITLITIFMLLFLSLSFSGSTYSSKNPVQVISPRLSPVCVDTLAYSLNSIKCRQDAGWENKSYCSFRADGFHIMDLDTKGRHACMAKNITLSNLDISFDIKINHGASATIYLRSKVATNDLIIGYYIRVNIDGEYSIQYNANDQPGKTEPFLPWTKPDLQSLKQGNDVWNTIRIALQASQISLWFNNTTKATPDFRGLLPPVDNTGIIGFGATTDNQKPPLDVVFRNLTISTFNKQ